MLAANEVGNGRSGWKSIFLQLLLRLILFVKAITRSVMERDVEVESRRDELIPNELIVLLMIVVGLVGIILLLPVSIGIFASRIVTPPILRHLCQRSVVPSHVRAFGSVERKPFYQGTTTAVSALQKIGVETRCCAVDVAVAADIRQTHVETPVILQKSRTEKERLFVRRITTRCGRERHEWFQRRCIGLQIYRRSEGRTTIG